MLINGWPYTTSHCQYVDVDTDTVGATSASILRLVSHALTEIDVVDIDATLRRVVRIASLLGDTHSAVRLGLDLRPSGGHPPANAEMTRRLMADPDLWGTPGDIAKAAARQYFAERETPNGLVNMNSVAEMRFLLAEPADREAMSGTQYREYLANTAMFRRHLELARHQAFTLLCQWERQLTFATIQDDALAVVRRRVDGLLASSAQDVLEAFNVTFRRLREVTETESPAVAGELLSQAVTSCRRILKKVVDSVEPATPGRPESADGHVLTDDAYRNRLVEFLRRTVTSKSFCGALLGDGESLFKRFASVDALASKGVHARLAADEAEFCALHTYLLAGEIMLLSQPSEGNDTAVTSGGES